MTKEEFKKVRLDLGLNRRQFALILGYQNPERISEIENGRMPISLRTEKLAKQLPLLSKKSLNAIMETL